MVMSCTIQPITQDTADYKGKRRWSAKLWKLDGSRALSPRRAPTSSRRSSRESDREQLGDDPPGDSAPWRSRGPKSSNTSRRSHGDASRAGKNGRSSLGSTASLFFSRANSARHWAAQGRIESRAQVNADVPSAPPAQPHGGPVAALGGKPPPRIHWPHPRASLRL
jgi:hypothetical protein